MAVEFCLEDFKVVKLDFPTIPPGAQLRALRLPILMAILNTLMLAEETRTLTMKVLARPGLQAICNCPMGESKPRDQGQGKQKAT